MMVGMIRPNSGKVFLDEEEISHLAMYKRAAMGIGYLPQEASIFRRLSVEDNIMAILQMTKLTSSERKERLEKLLEDLNVQHIRKSMGFQLSGGERRRTEIARALATNPSFILLDEPFAGVDPLAVEDIMKIVANLKKRGIGVLITDHNVHETLSIVDKAYILINGIIFRFGTAEELATDEEVRRLYLGEKFKLERYS
jgi:lipopolysaccharide export system ATP-binding protein